MKDKNPDSKFSNNNDEEIKKAVIKELSGGKEIWFSEIQRKLIQRNFFVSSFKLLQIINQMIESGALNEKMVGRSKVVSLSGKK